MKSAVHAILAVVLAAIGLQIIAEKLDFSVATAAPSTPNEVAGGNGRGGGLF